MIDLHMHSNFSDGAKSVPEIADIIDYSSPEEAAFVALTDHDTVQGTLSFFEEVLQKDDVYAISGTEVTALVDEWAIHILGYGFDPTNDLLTTTLNELTEGRRSRAIDIVKISQELGYKITLEEVTAITGNPKCNIGKPHIARVLIPNNHDKLKEYLKEEPTIDNVVRMMNEGGILHSSKKRITYQEAIHMIHDAGGYAVMAHPNEILTMEQFKFYLPMLVNAGLDGIEVFFGRSSASESDEYIRLAKQHDLLMTCGSDFHGTDDRRVGWIDFYHFNYKDLLNPTLEAFFG